MVSRLIVRADATYALGYGHLMRTLAVARLALADGLAVHYVGRLDDSAVSALDASIAAHDVFDPDWHSLVDEHSLVLVDATLLDDELTSLTRAAAVALIDDDAAVDRPVDFIVAPDLEQHPPDVSTTVLTGWDYALVRPEFTTESPSPSGESQPGRHLIAAFGGTDPTQAGPRLLDRLHELGHLGSFASLTLIEGPGTTALAHRPWVGDGAVEVVRNPANLVERMRKADAALTAGGTTMLELAALATPMAVTAVVDNQILPVERMVRAGAPQLDLDETKGPTSVASVLEQLGDPQLADRIAEAVHGLVDGQGGRRILHALQQAAAARIR